MNKKLVFPLAAFAAIAILLVAQSRIVTVAGQKPSSSFDQQVEQTRTQMFEQGKKIFRFDTFGDESFWGGTLHLHEAIAGEKNGGVGPGVSPKAALATQAKS